MEWKLRIPQQLPVLLNRLETFLSGMETDVWQVPQLLKGNLETFLSGMETVLPHAEVHFIRGRP